MELFDKNTHTLLETIVNLSDYSSCMDLQLEIGNNEDAVTYNLVKEIRNKVFKELSEINSDVKIKLFSQKNIKNDETKWGVDAIIVLYDHEKLAGKICLFEAKIDKVKWDKIEATSKLSHFSSQLSRQINPFNDGCVIWEQFYKSIAKLPAKSERSTSYSTCIFHQDAISHNPPHPNKTIWKVADIDKLASNAISNEKTTSMGTIIKETCEGLHGKEKALEEILAFVKNMPLIKYVLVIDKVSPELKDKIFMSLTEKKYEEFKDELVEKAQHKPKFRR